MKSDPKHTVIIVPGVGNKPGVHKRAADEWKVSEPDLNPVVHVYNWIHYNSSFRPQLNSLISKIDEYSKLGPVSLIGSSGGGNAVLNAFIERKKVVSSVVTVCAPVRSGNHRLRSMRILKLRHPALVNAIRHFEKNMKKLTSEDRKRILNVRAFFDEFVPPNMAVLEGANMMVLPTIEHLVSIELGLTRLSGPVLDFIKSSSSPDYKLAGVELKIH